MADQQFVLSVDVPCRWCGAKPGEPCALQVSGPPYVRYSTQELHLIRQKVA